LNTSVLRHCREAAPSFGAQRRPSFATRSIAMSLRRAAALVIAALAASAASAAAPITLAPMFRDHAVLQRDVPLPIWGTAEPGAEIRAFFFYGNGYDAPSYSAVADADGRWRIVFPAQPAGGPCELCVGYAPAGEAGASIALRDGDAPDGASLVAEDILIGDVWLCSGQSNMDMNFGWGLTRGKEDIETRTHPRIRLFDDRNRTALSPQRDLPDDYGWTPCDPAHAKSFSAVGYFFGQALQEAMPDVPIGLVEASWSGSPIKTWIPYERAAALGGDFGRQAGERRAIAEAWENGGAEQFKVDLAAWMEKLPAIDPGDAPAAPDFDDSDWQTAKLPEITEKHTKPDFDGWVWYRKTFVLEEDFPVWAPVKLSLGPIDDQDWTYVNGSLVGSTNAWDAKREYIIPANASPSGIDVPQPGIGVLHPGRNVIAVKVLDWGGHSGMWTRDESALALHGVPTFHCEDVEIDGAAASARFRTEHDIPLAGEWKFKAFPAEPRPVDPSSPSSWDIAACHNGMIAPLFGMAAKGAIWYQGCSDVGNADLYERQFPAMVGAWRKGFVHDDAGFPVYLVQLAAFKETHAEPIDSAWARMRWTQMQLGETVPHCGTAVAIDVGDHGDIHPKDKKTVGERLARLALARTYGFDRSCDAGPIPRVGELGVIDNATREPIRPALVETPAGRILEIGFWNGTLATSDGGPAKGFQLVDADGKAVWTDASIDDFKVSVSIPEGFVPSRVRYAWDDYPDCNLVNGEGLPCGPFELEIEP